jgi:hypothetical protein
MVKANDFQNGKDYSKLEEEKPSCGSCFWAIPQNNQMAIGQLSGECRRFPPCILMVQGRPVISWPIVNADERLFCWEWKK